MWHACIGCHPRFKPLRSCPQLFVSCHLSHLHRAKQAWRKRLHGMPVLCSHSHCQCVLSHSKKTTHQHRAEQLPRHSAPSLGATGYSWRVLARCNHLQGYRMHGLFVQDHRWHLEQRWPRAVKALQKQDAQSPWTSGVPSKLGC
jgi:hypothetical protein